jgi:NADP-dependent aldehyde dehydrogenase
MTEQDDAAARGAMWIAGAAVLGTGEPFTAEDRRRGGPTGPTYRAAGGEQIAAAALAAADAQEPYRRMPYPRRAALLDAIAEELEAVAPQAVPLAERETGLSRSRLEGEVARTTGQLRLFAKTVRDEAWLGLRLDAAQPERRPVPRPEVRMRRIPVGPVAVFSASNFPFAFSVAGGDTASALAAWCPVVVKAHESHPATSEIVASAVTQAVRRAGAPAGVFSVVQGAQHRVGLELVSHPAIAAVAFTGSRAGGLALAEAAGRRPVPIPVFAEMSSVNPVFLLPGALKAGAERLAEAYVASLTLGSGQFCTNPGLIFAAAGPDLDRFVAAATEALASVASGPMLSDRIAAGYRSGVARLAAHPGVRAVAGEAGPDVAGPALFTTDGRTFEESGDLAAEVFGPAGLIVAVDGPEGMTRAASRLEGQLTASVHAAPEDHPLAGQLLPLLERRAGRIVFDGWPTGVEVVGAMVHGGPYPATTDARSTSVGTLAMDRFLRPVAYQDVPEALLPPELRAPVFEEAVR